jgi:DNA-binding CsgD family transcriptional regulator
VDVREVLRNYDRQIYAAPNLDTAIEILADHAVQLGLGGASCAFWPRSKSSNGELPPPSIRLSSRRFGPTGRQWNDKYVEREMFKSDFVYRACMTTALPIVWSYDNRPEIVVGLGQSATVRELLGIEELVKRTRLRGGISIPIRGPGGFFGYVAYASYDGLDALLHRYEDHSDHLAGMAYRFYDAMTRELTAHDARERRLTAREIECLSLLAVGKTLEEAGHVLGLSYSTVRFHLHNAERKLGVTHRTHAIARAAFMGLLGALD